MIDEQCLGRCFTMYISIYIIIKNKSKRLQQGTRSLYSFITSPFGFLSGRGGIIKFIIFQGMIFVVLA